MTDRLTTDQRSRNMRAIRSENTGPERRLRSYLHQLGYRFRLRRRDLPGKPDIVMPRYRTAIFVHGCYWHGHGCPRGGQGAKSNQDYWAPKLERTKQRDSENAQRLRMAGWRVLTVWECELSELDSVKDQLESLVQQPY